MSPSFAISTSTNNDFRHRTFELLRELYPEGIRIRQTQKMRHREAFTTPGPNFVWCADGHMKLEMYGIEIYAAIDVYSRYITWFYIGISARTDISILSQFLSVLDISEVMPQHMRCDMGTETKLMAGAFWVLMKEHYPQIAFSDCFWYGPSTQNQRIESRWGLLTKGQTMKWREYFSAFSQMGEFSKTDITDQIALLAVYFLIIRQEVDIFVKMWNRHFIRKQKNRPGHGLPTGRPNRLFYNPPEPARYCGLPVPRDKLRENQEEIVAFGEYLLNEFQVSNTSIV